MVKADSKEVSLHPAILYGHSENQHSFNHYLSQKPHLATMLFIIGALFFFSLIAVFFLSNPTPINRQNSTQVYNTNQTSTDPQSTENWKTYRNNKLGFEFKYPDNLKLQENRDMVMVNHTIPYENKGDCDMIDENKTYKTLTDFNVSFEVSSKKTNLEFSDGTYKAGILDGEWVYEGVEGCGYIIYYFPIKNNKILVIKRDAIQALSGISTQWNREEILRVPGVIAPEESKKLFDQILFTFKFLDNSEKSATISPSPKDSFKDLCGDGTCQEIVCTAIGCPKPESFTTCPIDCSNTH